MNSETIAPRIMESDSEMEIAEEIHAGSHQYQALITSHDTGASHDTVVMPIHDDAKVLPFSLQCLTSFKGEIIFVLDKPTPESEALVRAFAFLHPNCRVITKKGMPFSCPNPASSSYIYGSLQATGNRIFWVGPDIVFPPTIFRNPLSLPCEFPYIQAHTHLAHAYFKVLFKISPQHCLQVFPRGFPFHKYNWYNEDINHECPQLLGMEYNRLKRPYVLHIRGFSHHKQRWFVKGIRNRKMRKNFIRILLGGVLFHKPESIISYVWQWRHERYMRNAADRFEVKREDERLSFGLDIGSGRNKVLGLGCDIRKVTDIQCSATHLPFRNKTFVISLLRHSLEHIPNRTQALTEAKRVAQKVYVILPKLEIWHKDRTHVTPFKVEGELVKQFELGNCFILGEKL